MKRFARVLIAVLALLIARPLCADTVITGVWTPADISGEELTLTVGHATVMSIGKLVCIQAEIAFPTTASNEDVTIGGMSAGVSGVFWPMTVGLAQTGSSVTSLLGSGETSAIWFFTASGAALKYSAVSGKTIVFGGCYQSA